MVELAAARRRFTLMIFFITFFFLASLQDHVSSAAAATTKDDTIINVDDDDYRPPKHPQRLFFKVPHHQQQQKKKTNKKVISWKIPKTRDQQLQQQEDGSYPKPACFSSSSHRHHQHRVTSEENKKHHGSATTTTTTLQINHKDWCSSSSTTTKKHLDKLYQQRLLSDHKYVRILQSHIRNTHNKQSTSSSSSEKSTTTTTTQIPITSGRRLQLLNYITTIQLGSTDLTLIVDTGSDLTWVQCTPCQSCYTQQEPLFNPLLSSSYHPLPCNATSCASIQDSSSSKGNLPHQSDGKSSSSSCTSSHSPCSYHVGYGDGSYSSGEVGTDHLTLGRDTTVNRFIFGCGRSNKGLFGSASGLLGLGRSDVSLISQTGSIFNGVFSYCLPSGDNPSATGSLTFGQYPPLPSLPTTTLNTTPIAYTNMVMYDNPFLSSLYLLNLTSITIGTTPLPTSNNHGRVVLIDSGTVITRLPPSIYTSLRQEFLKQFTNYPVVPGFSILDTCFDLSGYSEVRVPAIEFGLGSDDGGVVLSVDVSGVMYLVQGDASRACLAIASLEYEDELAIIGNYQQRNVRVVYDIKRRMVGFGKENCS